MRGDTFNIVLALFGLLILIYGLTGTRKRKIRVGFRDMSTELTGVAAKRLGAAYVLAGAVVTGTGFLSWIDVYLMPGDLRVLLIVGAAGAIFIGNIVGYVIGDGTQ